MGCQPIWGAGLRWHDGSMIGGRQVRYDDTSAVLASRSEAEMAALIDAASGWEVGVGGGSAPLDVNGVRVFTKRIPLTDRELAQPTPHQEPVRPSDVLSVRPRWSRVRR